VTDIGSHAEGRYTSGRSAERSRGSTGATRRTVLIALVANAVIAVVKLAGGLLSGSTALLAEAAHSLADTSNQGFLLVSIALGTREPSPEQPFGYGRQRYLWTFMAAVAMFLAGAVFAIGYGAYQIASGGEAGGYGVAYVTLAIAFAAEGTSWLRALRQTRREAREAGLSHLDYVRESRDPNVKMVLFEDSAALVGVTIALAGIVADQVTGSSLFDPMASIAVGLLLVGVAVWMGRDASQLLIGGAARPDEVRALEEVLDRFEEVDEVVELLTLVLAPNALLVAARVDLARGLDDDRIEEVAEEIDRRMREAVPDVTEVFLDPTARARPGL